MPPINSCENCGANEWIQNTNKNIIMGINEGLIEGRGSLANKGTKIRIYWCGKCKNVRIFLENMPRRNN